MERIGIYFKLKSGTRSEYKRRHDEIWVEITDVLNKAGIHNYSIWNYRDELFSYFEVEDFRAAQEILEADPVYHEWRKYMEDVINIDVKTEQKEYFMEQMFFHE